MKNTLLPLAIGILIGRQLYINYDKKEARKKEAQLQKRLIDALKNIGLSSREADTRTRRILQS